jgi:hypothetical protein
MIAGEHDHRSPAEHAPPPRSFPFDIKVSAAAEKAAQAPKGSIANVVVNIGRRCSEELLPALPVDETQTGHQALKIG